MKTVSPGFFLSPGFNQTLILTDFSSPPTPRPHPVSVHLLLNIQEKKRKKTPEIYGVEDLS